MTTPIIDEYLTKRATLLPWRLQIFSRVSPQLAVVIPCYKEFGQIPILIDSLSKNSVHYLEKTLVIFVVNNRPSAFTPREVIENNQATLELLLKLGKNRETPFPIGIVDASSPSLELPHNHGVGLARKIGLDLALLLMKQTSSILIGLVCLDADCRVSNNYIETWYNFFQQYRQLAGVMFSEHPTDRTVEGSAIVAYELYLRLYELGLHYACSPYAFLAIGSTIGVSPELYAKAGGMNTKTAGEDFYFLQQLAKVGGIVRIPEACVYPSHRVSDRVAFGTGPKVALYQKFPEKQSQFYAYPAFQVLRQWVNLINNIEPTHPSEHILSMAREIQPDLANFLLQNQWIRKSKNIHSQCKTKEKLIYHYHLLFDGLKTFRLIRHMSNHAFGYSNLLEFAKAINLELSPPLFPSSSLLNEDLTSSSLYILLLRMLREYWKNTLSQYKVGLHG